MGAFLFLLTPGDPASASSRAANASSSSCTAFGPSRRLLEPSKARGQIFPETLGVQIPVDHEIGDKVFHMLRGLEWRKLPDIGEGTFKTSHCTNLGKNH